MRHGRLTIALTSVAVVAAGPAVDGGRAAAADTRASAEKPSATASHETRCDRRCQDELARARDATERYWDVSVAMADGFVEVPGDGLGSCVSSPQGAVGIEYAHLGRSLDQELKVTEPESLLYLPEGFGAGRRLVAIQYSAIIENGGEPPELFGQPFSADGDRWVLRVWLYSANPDGLFAPATAAEACDTGAVVAPHGALQGCREVGASFMFPVEDVREVGGIPEELRLKGEDEEGGGLTFVNLLTFLCERAMLADGTEVRDVRIAQLMVNVEAPDWHGADDLAGSRYLLRVLVNSPELAKEWRQRTGMNRDVLEASPDVTGGFEPIAGGTGRYLFRSPEADLVGTVTDTVPTERPLFLRIWQQGWRGMGRLHFWVSSLAAGAAQLEVTPRPGSVLARLLECDPCDTRATGGDTFTFDQAPFRATVSRDWWNPRQDVGMDRSLPNPLGDPQRL